ncbi:hypothetical protein AOQ84DRAFT_376610 [Glonium stellatum]|uniref:Uncharacterized protein n=1 Tax=Glonium stellatum TaxID=574774 RepID=A0A8E2F102_9PEZI|nr:hypothetical protein AOQ84DRAFT_376610 [Glonium stellatum]
MMDLPRVRLGSPLPITPTKRRRGTVQDLLQQFGSKNSPSSVTRERKLSIAGRNDPHNRVLRQSCRISYNVSDSSDASPPSSVSSAYESPEKPQPAVMEDTTSDDEIDQPTVAPSSGRSLRSRAVAPHQTDVESLKHDTSRPLAAEGGRRVSSRKAKIILTSDTHVVESKSVAKAVKPKIETSRTRLRGEIATQTMARKDNFLLANKDYFLPLLPEHNYVAKLASNRRNSKSPIVEYTQIQEQPKGITATMKPYQLGGLSFLVHLHNNGMSGMLGDEMGLGKTLQTLSLFQYLEERDQASLTSSEENRPYLVVCPLAVLGSWVSEARKWVPELKVLRFHGTLNERNRLKKVATGEEDWYGNETTQSKKRKADRKSGKLVSKLASSEKSKESYKIVVTSYEQFVAEQGWFKKAFVWRYVVLDEGHKVKNNVTQVSTALQGLKAEYRLILTGTPLQNNLHEMWALLHWLYPEVFTVNSAELFKSSFDLNRGKVSTTVMDDARRLLELIMLRRMKNSPEVNLGLPPKEEILLYVPLTPMQRFWYTRLLTRMGDGMLNDLFSDVKKKEKDALMRDAQEDERLARVEELEKHVNERPDEWQETHEIMLRALQQEQKDSSKGSWQRLMNLIMQLRKCCSHPYLLPNAAPEPYHFGEHIIRASGKFIVLEKLLRESILVKGKKTLIFSGFTRTLDCCEDLLTLMGGHGESFRYLRFDGQTGRARRNLGIRMFNDPTSEYKVMLLSTRAGGLGINLASATEVIFMDEDWNPQITLQAEARAHRIGQTRPVTIYKLCTQGTVEEQMMGRIRKKLYLSAKITESMRNIHNEPQETKSKKRKSGAQSTTDDMPQLDTSQLKSLVRRGAQTLSHPEIDVTEMLSWDLETMLEKCRDKPSDPHIGTESAASADVDEEKWLSAMERVECAVFDGKRYQRALDAEGKANILPDEVTREDRRKGKNTTVMIDGFAINKESLSCADWEAVPTMAGKDPRLAEPVREKKAEINHEEQCHTCYDGGELVLCTGCPRSYHKECLTPEFQAQLKGWRGFYCPQHECVDCGKKTSDAGGMIFRCRWCARGYCEDCLEWDKTVLVGETLPEYEVLGEGANQQAFFISCPPCEEWRDEDPAAKEWFQGMEKTYQEHHAEWIEAAEASRQAYEEEMRRTEKSAMVDLTAETEARSPSLEPPSLVGSAVDTPATLESGVCTPRLMLKLSLGSKKRKIGDESALPNVDIVDDALFLPRKRARVKSRKTRKVTEI